MSYISSNSRYLPIFYLAAFEIKVVGEWTAPLSRTVIQQRADVFILSRMIYVGVSDF